ncbi:YLP motif-containing protein 1 [Camponotus floridanus]|uniref:YLP motif-containing protein 1 n=1 Tax=Camponotus floridanus TaxID=104421 RepID=E2ARX3_CAMFO|nr:YLP motif-containing protein 1 [Camponotus floridanus]
MQNWNQWQLSAGAVTTPVPQPPVGYAATAGADPVTLMQSYMQYYNQPTPSGYSPEQWAAAQQQGWAQWQQWQQQYQQWQAQYGDKYQETMKHLSTQNMSLTGQVQVPSNVQPPPLPKEDVRPPLPSATINTYQFANMPPPHQNNLPLFPTKEPNKTISQANVTNYPTNPPLPTSQPPLPPEIDENKGSILIEKCASNVISESNSATKLKLENDELTEAERTFDEQFQQWEEQFNKWKQQNANHPDKTQYKQYEAKWTSWREKLIERREQMRKKREQQKQVAVKAEAEKNKNISGDDKILNILSNTENQRLINNLLGIGQTLGLTGKQNTMAPLPPPPPPPPPLPETTNSNNESTTQETQPTSSQVNTIRSNIAPAWSNSQQWGNQQYNHRIEAPGFGPGTSTIPLMSSAPDIGPSQIISPNFAQPPPNLANNLMPNFSQPPPNFSNNDRPQLQNVRASGPVNTKDCPPFSSADSSNMDMRFIHPNDRLSHFEGQPNFRRSDQERFGREVNINPNLNEQDQFKPTDGFARKGDRSYNDGNNQLNSQNNFNIGNEGFGLPNDRLGNDRFNRENNRFGPMGNDRFLSGSDRFGGPNNDRLPGPGSDRFGNEWLGSEGDRFRAGIDRFGMDKDRRGPTNDRFGPDNERFPPDRFASGAERFAPGLGTDRFSSGNDRFGPNTEHFRSNDRFSKGNVDYFDSKDIADHRRDSFGIHPRGFNRNPSFSPPNELSPELKKLMEKRKAAGDVFRPSFIDSDKSSSVGSLSESFKKIAGDSPFKSSFDLQKNPPNRSGLMNFLNSGSSNFQLHSDSGQTPTSSYGLRGHPFKNDNEPPFRGLLDNFNKHPKDDNERSGKDMEITPHPNQSQPINIQSQVSAKHPGNIETTDSDLLLQTGNIVDSKNTETIQTNEADANEQKNIVISEDSSKKDNTEENKLFSNDILLQQDDKNHDNNQIQSNTEKTEESTNNNDSAIKKCESLPFMGENDPRPEDLNIEPPPELPNLSLISTNSNQNALLNPIEDFNKKESAGNKFDMRFDRNFGFRGVDFKSGAPFEPRESPMFGPRGPHMDPGPNTFQPQGSINTQLELRGSNDGHFGPNASNENRISPRRSNDEQFNERGRNESSEVLREQFGSRNAMDEQFDQFGSRTLGNGKFGLGRPTDLQFRPRGPIDSPFAPRNPGPFGPRGNEMQFRPRSINDRLDSRTIFEGPFGPRGLNDGPRGPNDSFFNTRRFTDPQLGPMGPGPNRFDRMNEVPFDKRPPFDNSGAFGFPGERPLRMPNEGPLGPLSSNDIPLGSRDSNDVLQRNSNFSENQFESRDSNDGSFGMSDFKARGPVNDSNNANFPPRGDPFHNHDYMRRNPYIREPPIREQFEDNVSAKKMRYESPKPADEFNRSRPGDENVNIEMQKDKITDYAGNISNVHKKELEILRPGYGPNDTWNKFGNDLRPDGSQQNDSNVPKIFDEKLKSEKITTEPKTVDYRSQYGESTASPADFQPKHSSNLFMKRSQLRPGQDFCAQRQFNYNHGEINKKFVESLNFIPMKVIDYGHASRLSIMDQHLSPVQCFDYGHGDLKPALLDREQHQQQNPHHYYPKKDFRNWVENEQNLKEYNETISSYKKGNMEKTRNYENYDKRRSTDYNKRKEHDWQSNDKLYEAEKKDNDDHKEKGYDPESESRFLERNSGNDQSDRCIHKERVQEIRESSRRETNKDNDKDDNRSKGSVNWQESSNKNVVDTKLQETSLPLDTKKNVVESKTLELAKMPNYTMVDDLLCPPGRQNRPLKIAIILRGPPGSGKSFVAKLIKEMIYEYEEAMEQSYITSLVKAFKKNITDGFFNFIILDCINEKISDYEEMWSFAKTKGFKVYVCEMEMDLQICLKRNIHNRTEDEINRIIDYFEPTPSYHQKLDVNSMLQEQAIEEVDMEDSEETQEKPIIQNEDSQDSHEDAQDTIVRWADLEERKEQEKMRAVGFVVGHTNWDRMMDPTKGGSALTRTKYI